MIDIINQRIAATKSTASELKKMINGARQQMEYSIMKQVNEISLIAVRKSTPSNIKYGNTNNMLRYASLTALLIGGIGWVGTAALWSKVFTIGGCAGVAYSFLRKDFSKCHPQVQSEFVQPAEVKISDSFIASESSHLINVLKTISSLWEDFSESSRSILVSTIENPSLKLSANDRFKLESLIRVSKTLSFPLIEYRNILEDASTTDKFKKAINKVDKLAIDEIDKVLTSQLNAYKEMSEVIDTRFR